MYLHVFTISKRGRPPTYKTYGVSQLIVLLWPDDGSYEPKHVA
jgi:hypothetical protein